jgi:hypothetical protein
MLEVQLYEVIKGCGPKYKTFLDEIMAYNGQTVLRPPPYHPYLNRTASVCAGVMRWVGANNTIIIIKHPRS